MLNYNHIEEAFEHKKDLLQYESTIPLPAFYTPPEATELYDVPRVHGALPEMFKQNILDIRHTYDLEVFL